MPMFAPPRLPLLQSPCPLPSRAQTGLVFRLVPDASMHDVQAGVRADLRHVWILRAPSDYSLERWLTAVDPECGWSIPWWERCVLTQ